MQHLAQCSEVPLSQPKNVNGSTQMIFMVGTRAASGAGLGLAFAAAVPCQRGQRPIVRPIWATSRCANGGCGRRMAQARPVYAMLACTALVQPYRRFVWLFGIELNSLGYAVSGPAVYD